MRKEWEENYVRKKCILKEGNEESSVKLLFKAVCVDNI
jgi:hypothetical protein